MKEPLLDAIEELGFTRNEAKVYLFLLRFGRARALKIAEKTGVSSSKVYDVLQRLKSKGVVGELEVEGVKVFTALPPAFLLDYIRNMKKELDVKEKLIEKYLPQFEKVQKEEKLNASVHIGKKGFEVSIQVAYSKCQR